MAKVQELSKEETEKVASNVAQKFIEILRDSKSKKGLFEQDFPMSLGILYDRTLDGKVIILALKKAYEETKEPVFEKLIRNGVDKIVIR